jgi:NAD(P)-dependent dehydrogenase (short-subunit alcohol dehydrogenase family)
MWLLAQVPVRPPAKRSLGRAGQTFVYAPAAVARVLIVGCGCRGRALAARLAADGHVVRGTTRSESNLAAIEDAGIEAALGDPDRLATLMPLLEGTSAVCWLMARVDAEPLHGPRLRSFLELLVDTPVRGLVYEAGGVPRPEGKAAVEAARSTWHMPVEIVEGFPADLDSWIGAIATALGRILGP